MSRLKGIFLALVLVGVAGCDANFNSIFRTSPSSLAKPHSELVFTDAKQSASFVQLGPDGLMRACAARSPDVFSALSTAFSGSGSADVVGKLSAAISGAGTSAESASAFGLRTQLTQSQIELLYQLCVASLNGTLSPDEFATEMHRYQNTMVTMLAIEQVTGYAKPTIVAIGGSSSAGSADALASTQAKIEAARKTEADLKDKSDKTGADLTKANSDLTNAKAALAAAQAAGKTGTDLTKPQGDVDAATTAQGKAADADKSAQKALSDQTTLRSSLETLLANQEKDVNLSAGSSTPVIVQDQHPIDPQTAAAVAGTVEQLQYNLISQTFMADECQKYLFHPKPGEGYQSASEYLPSQLKAASGAATPGKSEPINENGFTPLQQYCIGYLQNLDKYRFAQLDRSYGCDGNGANCKLPAIVNATVVTANPVSAQSPAGKTQKSPKPAAANPTTNPPTTPAPASSAPATSPANPAPASSGAASPPASPAPANPTPAGTTNVAPLPAAPATTPGSTTTTTPVVVVPPTTPPPIGTTIVPLESQ